MKQLDDDFWTEGDTGHPILPATDEPATLDPVTFDRDLGELTMGEVAINQGRRHLMPRTFTLG